MNAKGKGSVYYDRTNQTWIARFPIGRRNGKTIFKTKRATSEKAAKVARRELEQLHLERKLVAGQRKTFKAFADWYLEGPARNKLKENSRSKYIDDLTRHVFPYIGHMGLTEISPEDLMDLFSLLQREKGLSAASTNGVRKAVSGIFTNAVRLERRTSNPVKATEKVQPLDTEIEKIDEPWTQKEAINALRVAELYEDPLDPFIHLALATGMRAGEILGLHWQDIDFQKEVLWVKYSLGEIPVRLPNGRSTTQLMLTEPKTAGSRRPIPLCEWLCESLWRHRSRQSSTRLCRGGSWNDQGLVFTTKVGGPVYRSNYRDRVVTMCKKNNLRYISPRDMRHTFAVISLEQGEQLASVSQIMGHSSIDITKQIYARYIHTMSQSVTNSVEKALDPRREFHQLVERVIPTTHALKRS
jgi:integrase